MDKQIKNRKLKIKIASFLSFVVILTLLCQCATQPCRICQKDGEEIRKYMWDNEWWDYYERGLSFMEEGCFEEAIADFDKAIEQRDKDQWTARVEGVNFIDYFPNRERGIAYYLAGKDEDLTQAKDALEISLDQTPSAKTLCYLEKVYAKLLTEADKKNLKPIIVIDKSTTQETGENIITVSGHVQDNKYIKSISVNGMPVFLLNSSDDTNLYKRLNKKVPFKKQLYLSHGNHPVTIEAVNIMGVSDQKKS